MAVRVQSLGQSSPRSNRTIFAAANVTRSTPGTATGAVKYMTPLTSVPIAAGRSRLRRSSHSVSLVLILTMAISCSLSRLYLNGTTLVPGTQTVGG